MTYFQARRARAKRNHQSLYELARSIQAINPKIEVYVNRNESVHESMTFILGETINRISFTETPFQWNGPEPTNGYLPNHGMPYTAEDIISTMKTIEYRKGHPKEHIRWTDKQSLLKWCSWLVPINFKNQFQVGDKVSHRYRDWYQDCEVISIGEGCNGLITVSCTDSPIYNNDTRGTIKGFGEDTCIFSPYDLKIKADPTTTQTQ